MDLQRLRLILDASQAAAGAKQWEDATDTVATGAQVATGKIGGMETAMQSMLRQQKLTAQAMKDNGAAANMLGQNYKQLAGMVDGFESNAMAGAVALNTMEKAHHGANAAGEKHHMTIGKMERALESFAVRATGANETVGVLAAGLGHFALGGGEMIIVLAGVAALAAAWEHWTGKARAAREEQVKNTAELKKWYETKASGEAAERQTQVHSAQLTADKHKQDIANLKGLYEQPGPGGTYHQPELLARIKQLEKDYADEIAIIHAGEQDIVKTLTDGFIRERAAETDRLATMIETHHASAEERKKAIQMLKDDQKLIQQYMNPPPGTSDANRRILAANAADLARQIQTLQDALAGKGMDEALQRLGDEITRMHAEAASFGKDNAINTRVATLMDQLNALEKQYPELTDKIEKYKKSVKEAGAELSAASDAYKAKLANEETQQHVTERIVKLQQETDGLQRLNAVRGQSQYVIDQVRVAMAAETAVREASIDAASRHTRLTLEEVAAIYALAAAHERATIESQRDKKEDTAQIERVKEMLKQMQDETAHFFTDLFTKGVKTFGDLFDRVRQMFLKLVADMLAADLMRRLSPSLSALIPGIGGGPKPTPTTVGGGMGAGLAGFNLVPNLLGYGMAGAGGLGIGYTVGQSAKGYGMSALGGAASGAATGAMIGSVVPVVGTAVGAVLGGVAGLVGGLLGQSSKLKQEEAELKKARESFGKQLDEFVYSLGDHTGLEKGLHDLATQMHDLRDKARDLKLSTNDLATAETAAAAAGAKLKKDFLDSIDAQIRGATGKGYMNDALDAQKQYQANLRDIVTAGGNASKAADLFTDQLDNLAKGLTAAQIQDLLKSLPDLTKGMDAGAAEHLANVLNDDLAKALATAAQAAALASAELENRFTAATGGNNAIDVVKARNASELAAARNADNSPAYIAQLQVVQMWELAQARVQAQTAELVKAAQDQLAVQQDALDTAKQSLDATQRLSQSLTDYSKSLAVGTLSPLSPLEQKDAAQKNLADAFQAAMGGDQTAAGHFQDLAGTFLQLSQSYNASSTAYASDYSDVQDMLAQLTGKYGAQVSNDQKLVDAAQKQVDLLTAQIAALQDEKTIQQKIRDDVVAQVKDQRDAILAQADEQLSALYKMQDQNDTDLAETISQLDALEKMRDSLLQQGKDVPDALVQQIGYLATIKAEQELARDKIKDQIDAVNKVKDDANAAADKQIEAIKNGASLTEQGQLKLAAILVEQELAAADQNQKVIDAILKLIDALKNPSTGGSGGGGGGTGGSGGGGGGGSGGGGDGNDGNPVTENGDDPKKGLQNVVDAINGARIDARTTGAALDSRLQNLESAFTELVQISRFASRDST
jgi:hypothetical protein